MQLIIVSLFLNADAVQNGWSLDGATKMLTVRKQKVQTNQKLDASKLQRLTECVFHLEH
jgi:COP9 signalosome complex subunit 8